jgi:hypothetical protein
MVMTRLIVPIFAVALLAALVPSAAVPTPAAMKARVWLASQSPVRVAGTGFRAADRVAVTVTAGKTKLRRTVEATATGRIAARWNGSIAGGCHSTTVIARGTSGRVALWREVANDCGPPIGRL